MTTTTDTTPFDPPPLSSSAALFVDFDGTLVSIAPRPQDVVVGAWVVPALQHLQAALDGAVAVVSGRPIAQLDAFLAPLVLPAAGAHGAERRALDSGAVAMLGHEPPQTIVERAQGLAQAHDGLILEPKPSGFSLHYRARPELATTCRDVLVDALATLPGAADDWEWLHGHFVFELKQRAVSKGRAVEAFMAEPMFAGRQPVFVGDDLTDEDGIRAAQAHGGYGVRVGVGESAARYRLADTRAVAAWLGAAARSLGRDIDAAGALP